MDKSEKQRIPDRETNPVLDYTTEIIRYYVMFNKGKTEAEVCNSIWQYFCKINCERIWASENEERIHTFDTLTKENQEIREDYSIYTLFYDILSVETGLKKDSKDYKECMKSLGKALKKNNLSSVIPLKTVLYPEKAEKLRLKQEQKERKKQKKSIK